jgi:hypothetical protein
VSFSLVHLRFFFSFFLLLLSFSVFIFRFFCFRFFAHGAHGKPQTDGKRQTAKQRTAHGTRHARPTTKASRDRENTPFRQSCIMHTVFSINQNQAVAAAEQASQPEAPSKERNIATSQHRNVPATNTPPEHLRHIALLPVTHPQTPPPRAQIQPQPPNALQPSYSDQHFISHGKLKLSIHQPTLPRHEKGQRNEDGPGGDAGQ